jgi:simple sugar transport system permease protein
MDTFINFFNAAVLAGTPLLFGTLGEILTQKSGNLNLGVEGMMFMGALSGLLSVFMMEALLGLYLAPSIAVLVAVAFSFLAGALGALIYSVLVITFRTQQNVTGLALTLFGMGVGNFLGEHFGRRSPVGFLTVSASAREGFSQIRLPFLSDIPVLGPMLFNYNILVYLGIAVAVILAVFFKFTRVGLNLRAVGENPSAADAASIPVSKYKYAATCIGGGICGIGGMYIIMVTTSGIWVYNAVQGFGWISVALVIFATWSPGRAVVGSLLFGALTIMRFYVPLGIPMQIYDTLPYVATIVVLIFTSIRPNREYNAPAHLGLNYFREDR